MSLTLITCLVNSGLVTAKHAGLVDPLRAGAGGTAGPSLVEGSALVCASSVEELSDALWWLGGAGEEAEDKNAPASSEAVVNRILDIERSLAFLDIL